MSRPDAVSGAVLESLGPAGLGDATATGAVDGFGRHPRAHPIDAGPLRLAHHRPDVGQLALGLTAHEEGTGHVRAIPVEGRRRNR